MKGDEGSGGGVTVVEGGVKVEHTTRQKCAGRRRYFIFARASSRTPPAHRRTSGFGSSL
jgi:hypothetical protein